MIDLFSRYSGDSLHHLSKNLFMILFMLCDRQLPHIAEDCYCCSPPTNHQLSQGPKKQVFVPALRA